jgi:glycosyltransferase involved in cell wall biosynthesis
VIRRRERCQGGEDRVMTDDVGSATVAETPAMPVGAADLRPMLSVIIACLNGAATLGTQLEALARQDCPVSWELLLADNGSTDASVAIAESFRPRIPTLRVIDASRRRGAGPARNHGVEQALGDWIAFCDADDEVAPDWLALMAAALAQHPFVAGRFESHRLNGTWVLRSRPLQQQEDLQSSDIGARLPHAGGGNMGIHRDAFLRVGGFDPKIRWLEDTDFSWRAQLAGVPLVFRNDVVVHVRLRQTYRSMYAQGRQYGMAQALLEERYGRPASIDAPVDVAPGDRGRVVSRSARARSLITSLIDHLIAGKLAWRVGWVVGHRSHRAGRSDRVEASSVSSRRL